MRSIAIRDELTGEWKERGVKEQREYGTKAEMADLELHQEDFHGEWNYTLKPRPGSSPSRVNRQ